MKAEKFLNTNYLIFYVTLYITQFVNFVLLFCGNLKYIRNIFCFETEEVEAASNTKWNFSQFDIFLYFFYLFVYRYLE